jgi:hypothetical protein
MGRRRTIIGKYRFEQRQGRQTPFKRSARAIIDRLKARYEEEMRDRLEAITNPQEIAKPNRQPFLSFLQVIETVAGF